MGQRARSALRASARYVAMQRTCTREGQHSSLCFSFLLSLSFAVAETKKARRSITMPNLKDMLEAEMEKERKEEEEAATKQSTTERRKSRRLSLRFNSSLLQSRSKTSSGS